MVSLLSAMALPKATSANCSSGHGGCVYYRGRSLFETTNASAKKATGPLLAWKPCCWLTLPEPEPSAGLTIARPPASRTVDWELEEAAAADATSTPIGAILSC